MHFISLARFSRTLLATGLVACALGTQAQSAIKVAGPLTTELAVLKYTLQKGYFKAQGLDVEILTLNSGPAAVSAVMSGSAEVGYSASVPVLFARANRQPVRVFDVFSFENAKTQYLWLVASDKSGVKSMKDLVGKTVAINGAGTACDLLVREHMAKAGVPMDAIKTIVLPFPQLEAALTVGNADAACVVNPFATSIKISPNLKGTTIASGILADQSKRSALDVLFVNEKWGTANKPALIGMQAALRKTFADFQKDPTIKRRLLEQELRLSPAFLSLMGDDVTYDTSTTLSAANLQVVIDGLAKHGLMKNPYKAEELILPLK